MSQPPEDRARAIELNRRLRLGETLSPEDLEWIKRDRYYFKCRNSWLCRRSARQANRPDPVQGNFGGAGQVGQR